MSGILDGAMSFGPKWAPNSGIVTPGSSTTSTSGQNTLRLVPLIIPNTVRISQMSAEVTVIGDVGALLRMGIWESDAQGAYPARLLTAPTGTTVAADAVGFAGFSPNLVLPAGVYWLGGMSENTATAPTYRMSTSAVYPLSTTVVNQTAGGGLSLTGQSPGSFTNLTGAPFGSTATTFKFNLALGSV